MAKTVDEDAYGKGLVSYLNGNKKAKFSVFSNKAQSERWPIELFFRPYSSMPELEHVALSHCKGRILDIGAGAGSHALWLKSEGRDVTPIDISQGAIDVMKRRGLENARQADFFQLNAEKYDTLLFLMNGFGIVGTMNRIPVFFKQCKNLLAEEGKIIVDSSDLIYLYADEEGEVALNINDNYYGEMEYRMDFANHRGVPFQWLFIDKETLTDYARQNGFSTKILYEDDHYQYLAELSLL